MTVKFHEVNQSVTLTTAVQLLVFLQVQINENSVIQYTVIELMNAFHPIYVRKEDQKLFAFT